jgi:hypothetical protein
MLPYWLLFGACAIGALIAQSQVDQSRPHPMLWVMGLVIALMVGLRYEIGADWDAYLRIFEASGYSSFEQALGRSDPAFQVINWWAAHSNWRIWVVNLICAGLFSWGLIRFCLVQPYPWIALTVAVPYVVIVVAMGYTRQGAALGIILAGLANYLRRESILKFAAYIAFAATFHATAVVVFILVAWTSRRNRLVNLIGAVAVTILFYNLFLGASVERFYGIYIKTGYSSQGALIRVMMDVTAAVMFAIAGRKLAFSEVEHKIWRNFAIASFVALAALLISPSSTAIDRLAIYLLPIQIAVFGRLPILASRNEMGRLGPIILFGAVQFVWLNFAQFAQLWLPYQMFSF